MSQVPKSRSSVWTRVKTKAKGMNARKAKFAIWTIVICAIVISAAIIILVMQTGSNVFSSPVAYNAADSDQTAIPNADVSYETWAIPKASMVAWSADKEGLFSTYAVLIDSGTTLSDWILTTAQKETYGAFFIKAWAINTVARWLPFKANWLEINLAGSNKIGLMPTPTQVGISFVDSETGLAMVLNTTRFVNFTVYISVNASETSVAGYQPQFNWTAGYKSRISLELTFNDTISKNSITYGSMPAEVQASTKITYTVETTLTGTKINSFTCPQSTALAITAANLYWDYYGEKYLLAAITSPAGWATAA